MAANSFRIEVVVFGALQTVSAAPSRASEEVIKGGQKLRVVVDQRLQLGGRGRRGLSKDCDGEESHQSEGFD